MDMSNMDTITNDMSQMTLESSSSSSSSNLLFKLNTGKPSLKVTLTRYLYEKEEVILSFVTSLILKEEYKEVIFWFSEYYFSQYEEEAWELIWKVYYDFYAVFHPKLESFIMKKYHLWKKNNCDIKYPLDCIKNIYNKKVSGYVFNLRMYMNQSPVQDTIINKKYEWLDEYPCDFRILIKSIHHYCYKNICYFIAELDKKNQLKNLYGWLIKYFNEQGHISLKKNVKTTQIESIQHPEHYVMKHIILALIIHMTLRSEKINIKQVFIQTTKKELEYVNNLNERNSSFYTLLENKREFKIYPDIGSFNLPRFEQEESMQTMYLYHWDYYAYKCPLWNKRFNERKHNLNELIKEVEFKNDAEQDKFYDLYGLDHDDLMIETQLCSTMDIEIKSWFHWFSMCFKRKHILIYLDEETLMDY
uniref:Uncharacterized protein n=1 Tax=viral metagenome TaxID=1070528 RepID=A0A6C0KDW9_9ZZZZ